VVVGILIALVAEQAVQTLEWRHKVELSRQALVDEIAVDDGPQLYQRAEIHPCLIRQLDSIRSAVEGNAGRAQIASLIDAYQTEYLSYESQARDAMTVAGVAVHFPEAEYAHWLKAYAEIPVIDRTGAQEVHDIAQLHAFSHSGGPLSEAEKDAVLQAAAAVQGDETVIYSSVRFSLPQVWAAGLTLDPKRMKIFTGWAQAHYSGCLADIPTTWNAD